MSIKKLMSRKLVLVKADDNLGAIRDIFSSASFHHLLVVEKNKLVGIISDRDYFKSINASLGTPTETSRDLIALKLKAHQIMSRNIVSLYENDTMVDLINTFHKNKLSCIPIVTNQNAPIGIITWKDIIRYLAVKMAAKV